MVHEGVEPEVRDLANQLTPLLIMRLPHLIILLLYL